MDSWFCRNAVHTIFRASGEAILGTLKYVQKRFPMLLFAPFSGRKIFFFCRLTCDDFLTYFSLAAGQDGHDGHDEAPLHSAVVRFLTNFFLCLRRGDFRYTTIS